MKRRRVPRQGSTCPAGYFHICPVRRHRQTMLDRGEVLAGADPGLRLSHQPQHIHRGHLLASGHTFAERPCFYFSMPLRSTNGVLRPFLS